MAGRGRASSQKKQKEIARLEKRQQKAQRKEQRKSEPRTEEELRVLDGPINYGDDEDDDDDDDEAAE